MALDRMDVGLIVRRTFRINGQAIAGSPDLFDTPTTPKYPVGTRMTCDDGRVFRYGYADGAMNRGVLAATDITDLSLADTDGIFVAAAAGATTIQISSASLSAAVGVLSGGLLGISDDDGEGYQYGIQYNDVTAANVTSIYLSDPLQAALTTDSDGFITSNLWMNLVIASTTDRWLAGVTCATFAQYDYGWLQTWGPAVVLDDGGTTFGAVATLSDGVSGAVQDLGGGGTTAADLKTEAIVGYITHAGDNTGHAGVMLQIHP